MCYIDPAIDNRNLYSVICIAARVVKKALCPSKILEETIAVRKACQHEDYHSEEQSSTLPLDAILTSESCIGLSAKASRRHAVSKRDHQQQNWPSNCPLKAPGSSCSTAVVQRQRFWRIYSRSTLMSATKRLPPGTRQHNVSEVSKREINDNRVSYLDLRFAAVEVQLKHGYTNTFSLTLIVSKRSYLRLEI
jgi:hypothetical protein